MQPLRAAATLFTLAVCAAAARSSDLGHGHRLAHLEAVLHGRHSPNYNPAAQDAVPELRKLLNRIPQDLEPWRKGITLEMVERTYCTDYEMSFRLQIVGGRAYIAGEFAGYHEFNRNTKLLILDVMKRFKLPDVDIVFTTADRCPSPGKAFTGSQAKCPAEAPVFAFDKTAGSDSHCVLYPDFTFGSGGWPEAKLPSWEMVRDIMELRVANQSSSVLHARIPRLFFRGAPTGNRTLLGDDESFMNHPDTDFLLTGWTGETDPAQYVALPDHCKYRWAAIGLLETPEARRYLLNVDGNGYSARLKYLLLCGSPVIFPNAGLHEFYHHLLEDGVHVVMTPPLDGETRGKPVLEALQALKDNPARAERIAAAGRDFVTRVLTPETVHRYFAELLHHYASLQTFQPTVHPDAVPIYSSAMSADALNTLDSRTCTVCARKLTWP